MKTFFSYRKEDYKIVHLVKRVLAESLPDIVALWENYLSDPDFLLRLQSELPLCTNFVLFLSKDMGNYQMREELPTFWRRMIEQKTTDDQNSTLRAVIVRLCDEECAERQFNNKLASYGGLPRVVPSDDQDPESKAIGIAKDIAEALKIPWNYVDGLPADPHLFDYEKDVIQHFRSARDLYPNGMHPEESEPSPLNDSDKQTRRVVYQRWLKGCPTVWPTLKPRGEAKWPNPLGEKVIGKYRPAGAQVLVTALNTEGGSEAEPFTFPEAGPRAQLYFRPDAPLRIGILVSGGIAPGINAVIDGIAQRHWQYAREGLDRGHHHANLAVRGFKDGFLSSGSVGDHSVLLIADKLQPVPNGPFIFTPDHAHEGGSILGTSRVSALLHPADRIEKFEEIDNHLLNSEIDILYLIGGDGTMKAAHSLYEISRKNRKRRKMLSVVAIPKTMDNDVLWMWQSFGFLSAVEKAREVVELLNTEVQSNPRLCVVQLFGSDSGFVVSHAVLASATGHCDAALIPEVEFSMDGLITHLRRAIHPTDGRPPHGIVVMAESAIPTDASRYSEDPQIALTDEEKKEIDIFLKMREAKGRIQGQTEDALRSAGLKIVSRGLLNYLPPVEVDGRIREWELLRVVTNEPRHQLRSISPSCLDVINGQRLGTLAVDNAMAGYTDFMISQWLTEYVLVPLKLVVLGRKRIPDTGIFWKSVLAKTGQPADMI